MTISDFQRLIEQTYFQKDAARGAARTFLWFVEEVGELASSLKKGSVAQKKEEFGDVLAWLFTLASLSGVEMEDAASRYFDGCPLCKSIPCKCAEEI